MARHLDDLDPAEEWEAPEGPPSPRVELAPWRPGDDGPPERGDDHRGPDLDPPGPTRPATHVYYLAGEHADCPSQPWWHAHPVGEAGR